MPSCEARRVAGSAATGGVSDASLTETQNHLIAGKKKYWKPEDFEQAWRLSCRTMKAIVPYLLYLESCDGEIPRPKPADETQSDPPPEADAQTDGSTQRG